MATEIVSSLFGLSPEMYGQQQQMGALKTGMALANMDPAARGAALTYAGGAGLGGAIGGALGAQDPQLKLISARNAVSQQIDQTNPESIMKGAQMLAQIGDNQGAFALADYARKAQSEMAQAQQRSAAAQASIAQASRERQAAVPTDIQVAREIATLQANIDSLSQAPASPARDQALRQASTQLAQLERLTTKADKLPSFGTDREAVAAEVYDKPFAQLTPAQKAAVNKRVEEEGGRKAAAGAAKLVMPGEKQLVDIPGFRANVQKTIEAPLKAIFSVDNALANIDDAIKTDNFASYRAAQTQFAKAIAGAGDLSQKELKAAGADPSFVGGTADYLSSLATSTPTKDTMQKMQSAMQTIKKVNTAKATAEIERQRKIAAQAGYPAEAVKTALDFPELQAAPSGAPSGGDLAARAAAELKRRQSGAK